MVSAIGFTLSFFPCTIFFSHYWYLHPNDPLRFHQIMHTLFILWSSKCCRSTSFQGVFRRFFHYLLSVNDGQSTFILFFFVFKRFFHYLLSVHDRHPSFILFFFVSERFFHYLLSVHDRHPSFILFFFVFERFFHYLLSVDDRHPSFILFFFVFNIYDVPLSRRYCKFTILAIWVQITFVLLFYLS